MNTRRLDPDPQVNRTLNHSIRDGVWFSAMVGGAESYFGAFAVFLQATAGQIALLSSLPPLLAALSQPLSAWLGRSLGVRKPIIVFGAVLQAVVLLAIAALPQLFPACAMPLLIGCAVLYFVGPNLGAPQWGSLMGDLVADSRRGRFFALRTRLSSIASFAALIVSGLLLQSFDAGGLPWLGFGLVFVLAAGARAMSAWHLVQMHDPPGHVAAMQLDARGLWASIRGSGFGRFSLFFAAMQMAVGIAAPFFALYMLRDLGFTYAAFMTNTAVSVLLQFLTLNRWGRLSDLFGNRLILITTGSLMTCLPALWLVSTNYFYLLAVQALSGLVWAGFTLSATNFVFDLTPREQRATLMAGHNLLAACAVFLGAMFGGWLASAAPAAWFHGWLVGSPLYVVFAVSSMMRVLVAVSFLPFVREVRRVRRMSAPGLLFRVVRLAPLSALVFEVIGRERPRQRRVDDDPGDDA